MRRLLVQTETLGWELSIGSRVQLWQLAVPGQTAPGMINLVGGFITLNKTRTVNSKKQTPVEVYVVYSMRTDGLNCGRWTRSGRFLHRTAAEKQFLCLVDWLVVVRGKQSYRYLDRWSALQLMAISD